MLSTRVFISQCRSLKKQWRQGLSSREYSNDKSSNEGTDEIKDEGPNLTELLRGAANFNESTDKTWATTPYPEGAPSVPEGEEISKPKMDPLDTSVLLFPGQGILKVGAVSKYMKFPRVKELFESANSALGYDLEKLCLHGPQSQLNRTEFNQPATVVASLAALERLWEERPRAIETCKVAAGYSVGELTALVFSGAIEIEDAIRLAAVRGAAMQKASQKCPQGMIFAFCSAKAKIVDICKDAQAWATDLGIENPICRIAVYLYTQGKVLAGNEEALRYIEKNGKLLHLFNLKSRG
ncbi:probable malonyl-CoA-acyl carrier protein transacylase, mitochondrial isoform X2 [Venturia canescens]|uniref:probable malonyl-CoA-acyl carrier protein transacylase, mitochondrial isoform X2 n=1 Tax=Venturia canescens TaxID=32260 RepID=UPI001C9D0B89|nr:probable malonyl-CoA-acyl carrier protein transacylase, mitochondrial isoform X2 [Venturia canescens]